MLAQQKAGQCADDADCRGKDDRDTEPAGDQCGGGAGEDQHCGDQHGAHQGNTSGDGDGDEDDQTIVDSAIDFVDTNTDENSGSLEALKLDVKTGDEIEILADAFNKMTGDITRYITELTNTASERERINTELRVATLIQ
jgi:hypothetical protein